MILRFRVGDSRIYVFFWVPGQKEFHHMDLLASIFVRLTSSEYFPLLSQADF